VARPWIKLHTSMLDHPGIGMLPPDVAWRYVQFLLLAGRADNDGAIGTVASVAWALRCPEADVEAACVALNGRVERRDDVLIVRDWAEWQPPTTSAERVARHRSAARDEVVTSRPRYSDEVVTKLLCHSDALEVEQELEREQETTTTKPPAPKRRGSSKPNGKPRERKPLYDAFCSVWHLPDGGGRYRGLAGDFDARCREAGATVDEFGAFRRMSAAAGEWGKFVVMHNCTERFLTWRDVRRRALPQEDGIL